MSAPITLPMPWLRAVAAAFLPDVAAIARYTETSTSDGITETWTTIASGIPCRVSPRATTATEGLAAGGAVVRAVSPWLVTLPFGTDVTVRDRITVLGGDRVDGRTFEAQRVDERSYEAARDVQCELVT
jgi:Family of unknown function (DUF6093)